MTAHSARGSEGQSAYDELVDAVQGKYDAIHGEGVVKVTYHPEDNADHERDMADPEYAAEIRAIIKSGMWDGAWAKGAILRLVEDNERQAARFHRCRNAAGQLAGALSAFVDDPNGEGIEALRSALQTYVRLDSGGFDGT